VPVLPLASPFPAHQIGSFPHILSVVCSSSLRSSVSLVYHRTVHDGCSYPNHSLGHSGLSFTCDTRPKSQASDRDWPPQVDMEVRLQGLILMNMKNVSLVCVRCCDDVSASFTLLTPSSSSLAIVPSFLVLPVRYVLRIRSNTHI
jgi:hypothetical protein